MPPILPPQPVSTIDWSNLVRAIEANTVLPVVGRELLIVDDEGVTVRYDQALARRLADKLSVEIDAGRLPELEDVALTYIRRAPGDWATVCTELSDIMVAYRPEIPASLAKLAELPFRLFLTTTFDDLLLRALGGAPGGTNETAKAYEHGAQRSIDELEQLPRQIPTDRRAVYHLLGRIGQPGDFPLTEEDTLEILKKLELKLETRSLEVAGLAAHLEQSQILVLGCGYPDWLLRFFVRTLRRERYRKYEERRARVAEPAALVQRPLAQFFDRYGVPVFSGDLGAFVDTLHARWSARRGPIAAPIPASAAGDLEAPVVLAYGPSDRANADRVAAVLSSWRVAARRREWSRVTPLEPLTLDACAVYAAFLSGQALRDIPEVSLLGEWSSVQQRQESQEGHLFGTLMIMLDIEAKRRQQQPSSRDWPAWKRARIKSPPATEESMIDSIARALFDAGRLPRPDRRLDVYCVTSDSPEDVNARDDLYKQLKALRFIDVKDHTTALAGAALDAWKSQMEGAQIIVLLVTPDLLGAGKDPAQPDELGEVDVALARHRDRKALVVPVLVRSLYGWRESLEANGAPRLDPVPRRDDDFLSERPNEDAAWSEAARELAFRIQLHWLRNQAPLPAVAG